jgi:two-component system chemotaxis response regulator CheB
MSEERDIIVLGGSAGGIEALEEVVRGIAPDIPAAIFVVVHMSQESPDFLAEILSKVTRLKVRYAIDREPIELGTVYIAKADWHLLIKPGEVRVVRGPKENNFRPALDPLFRSAAYTYGSRVIGGVLSGLLDDGSHGLYQIKQRGGVTIAQDPRDAIQPNMPQSAITQVGVDYVTTATEMGELLNKLTRGGEGEATGPAPEQLDVAEGAASGLEVPNRAATSALICPECGGSLWEVHEGNLVRFRCHVGHGYSGQTLVALQDAEVEQALWTSVRLLEEQSELHRRMSENWRTSGNRQLRDRFVANAEDRKYAADLVRSLITGEKENTTRLPVDSPDLLSEYNGQSGQV